MGAQTWLQCAQVACNDGLVDALDGTDLADFALQHNFGLYVLRGGMKWAETAYSHDLLRSFLVDVPTQSNGDKTRLFKAEQIDDHGVLGGLTQWLLSALKMNFEGPWNHVQVQWHSFCEDASSSFACPRQPAWKRSTELVWLHLGSPGILCYQPRHPTSAAEDSDQWSVRQL